ncbi:MAG TPA: ABC transporter permease [Puia sp.]|jgi:putative ABC transport system permease protein|nr:ABC transporter permease [Puia sp.]
MLRTLLKRKAFTLINLLGLTSGMAVCMLLTLYIQGELNWDSFHAKSNRMYRLGVERKYTSRIALRGEIPQSIGQAVQKEFPEVEQSVRVMNISNGTGAQVIVEDKYFQDNKTLVADSNFFTVFDADFIAGNGKTALHNVGSVVLNESTAKRYFGSAANALGKHLTVNNNNQFVISAVCKDWPEKSHLQFDILASMTTFPALNSPNYYDFYVYDYLLLKNNVSAATLEAKLPSMVEKYVAPTIPQGFGESYQQFLAEGNGYRYFLQPLPQIHLQSNFVDEIRPGGSLQAVYLFTGIAIFILFLACINFINLSTAMSVERAREVGIRKTFGSDTSSILWRFLSESVFFSIASILVAAGITALLTPTLSRIAGRVYNFNWFVTPLHILAVLSFSVLIGLIAGIYPAFVLSSFKPILVLKGRFKSGVRGLALRNSLVVFQFAISIILIIATIVVNDQLHFVLGDRLGFDKDNIISIDNAFNLRNFTDRSQAFMDELKRINGVTDMSRCGALPDGRGDANCAMQVVGTRVQRTQATIFVDDRYQQVLGLTISRGRFFSRELPTDSFSMVLNEAAVKDFGLTNPIGSKIVSTEPFFNAPDGKQIAYTVIGVVKDFHFQSLHNKIVPLVIANRARFGWGILAVKVSCPQLPAAVSSIEKLWKQMEPKHELKFSFLDQNIAELYKSEQTAERIVTIFSSLAVFIACIGLLGLVTFTTTQRTREIGIRKVLGATVGSIFIVLSKDFLRLIAISMLIAFPVAWWATNSWLNSFAYRINAIWWIFMMAGALAFLIAFVTISFQVVKAAIANPIKSLRTE